MIKRITIVLCAIIISGFTLAQSNRSLIKSGDEELTLGNYSSAVYFYSQVINKLAGESEDFTYHPYSTTAFYKSNKKNKVSSFDPPKNPNNSEKEVIHKIADAYRLAKDYGNAEKWYQVAVANPREENPYAAYFYGESLMKNGKYEEARIEFQKTRDQFPNEENKFNRLALDKQGNCEFALSDVKENIKLEFEYSEFPINKGSTSFGMMFTKDGYIFNSARPDTLYDDEGNAISVDNYNSNIYTTKRKENGTFTSPKLLDLKINTDFNEGAAIMSPDGRSLFFTRVNPENRNETAIYVCRRFNGIWLEPFKLGDNINKEGFKSSTPYLHDDGITLYYSSNRPGGEGGMDIWVTTINQDGETTEPKNLGSNINTKYDEISPFHHGESKTLFFASEGHIGLGGLDIFQSQININTNWWGRAANVGKPINSSRDDSYYVLDKVSQTGFVTSDRESCKDCDSSLTLNAHCNRIYALINPDLVVKIEGYVYDNDSGDPIPGAKVTFKDVRGLTEEVAVKANEEGFYSKELALNEEYFIKASKRRYFADATVENTLGLTTSTTIEHDFYLNLIPTGEIEIKGIEYDFDKATLRPNSKKELDKLVNFLNLNSNLKVQIRSHTDERGGDAYNLKLSKARAKSVVVYLSSKGINRDRLQDLGLGETDPATIRIDGEDQKLTPKFINSLADDDKQEEYHQRNRRTAFKVLAE